MSKTLNPTEPAAKKAGLFLYLTSVLYAFFLAMCIAGLLKWQRAARRTIAAAA